MIRIEKQSLLMDSSESDDDQIMSVNAQTTIEEGRMRGDQSWTTEYYLTLPLTALSSCLSFVIEGFDSWNEYEYAAGNDEDGTPSDHHFTLPQMRQLKNDPELNNRTNDDLIELANQLARKKNARQASCSIKEKKHLIAEEVALEKRKEKYFVRYLNRDGLLRRFFAKKKVNNCLFPLQQLAAQKVLENTTRYESFLRQVTDQGQSHHYYDILEKTLGRPLSMLWLELSRKITAKNAQSYLELDEANTQSLFELTFDPSYVCGDVELCKVLRLHPELVAINCSDCIQLSCRAPGLVGKYCGANLEYVDFSHCQNAISNGSLLELARAAPNIVQLSLKRAFRLSDTDLIESAKCLPNLEKLDISFCTVTERAVISVARHCPKLFSLNISSSSAASSGSLIALGQYSQSLIELHCSNGVVTDMAVRYLVKGCKKLKKLVLRSCKQLTNQSVCEIARFSSQLEHLDVYLIPKITDEKIPDLLVGCPKLRSLFSQHAYTPQLTPTSKNFFMKFRKKKKLVDGK